MYIGEFGGRTFKSTSKSVVLQKLSEYVKSLPEEEHSKPGNSIMYLYREGEPRDMVVFG
jgi:hypothetical protein